MFLSGFRKKEESREEFEAFHEEGLLGKVSYIKTAKTVSSKRLERQAAKTVSS